MRPSDKQALAGISVVAIIIASMLAYMGITCPKCEDTISTTWGALAGFVALLVCFAILRVFDAK